MLTIVENILDPKTWEHIETDDVCATLAERYSQFPATGRIYHGQIADSCDVTPRDEAGIERLQSLDGQIYVVVYPEFEAAAMFVLKALATIAISMVVSKLLAPNVPTQTARNQQAQSPNGALSGRTNTARLNGRIPSIYGTVWSVPDQLALPYSIFDGNREIEISYLGVGTGLHEIHQAVDDWTPYEDISGQSLEVYGPNTSPNSGTPYFTIGDPIAEPILEVVRSKSVNGQVLRAPNENQVSAADTFVYTWPRICSFCCWGRQGLRRRLREHRGGRLLMLRPW